MKCVMRYGKETSKKRPKLPDCLIAATCLVFNLELYTLNLKDFDYIKGLKLYKPKKYF